jgi:hypothetical protein
MAFSLDGLYMVGPGGSAPRIWTYTTTDALADVNTSGYMDDAANELTVGDLIYGVTSTGTTNVHAQYLVLTIAAGVVDLSDGVVIATTDGD